MNSILDISRFVSRPKLIQEVDNNYIKHTTELHAIKEKYKNLEDRIQKYIDDDVIWDPDLVLNFDLYFQSIMKYIRDNYSDHNDMINIYHDKIYNNIHEFIELVFDNLKTYMRISSVCSKYLTNTHAYMYSEDYPELTAPKIPNLIQFNIKYHDDISHLLLKDNIKVYVYSQINNKTINDINYDVITYTNCHVNFYMDTKYLHQSPDYIKINDLVDSKNTLHP